MPYETVDEVADYTDMQGQASQLNGTKGAKAAWRSDPAKMMIVMWVGIIIFYAVLRTFFSRYTT
jgi:hypothetical protein